MSAFEGRHADFKSWKQTCKFAKILLWVHQRRRRQLWVTIAPSVTEYSGQ